VCHTLHITKNDLPPSKDFCGGFAEFVMISPTFMFSVAKIHLRFKGPATKAICPDLLSSSLTSKTLTHSKDIVAVVEKLKMAIDQDFKLVGQLGLVAMFVPSTAP